MKDIYLVIGGSGFVGRHIVEQLVARGDVVSVFDIVQRHHDVPFYSGDITEKEQVASAIRKSGATCVIHTASPPALVADPALFWKVNVDGTKAVIAACKETRCLKLVYTSSAGVVFNGADLYDVDERLPEPDVPLDGYNESKAKGEQAVLEANGEEGLLTVALRPAGIFGPGDRQVMAGLYKVYHDRKTHWQIGDNNNLFDWTYVGNVAKAHLVAADKLAPPLPLDNPDEKTEPGLSLAEQELVNTSLPSINLTTPAHRIPTSAARPLGPYVTLPANGEEIEKAWNDPSTIPNRPVVRTRFDALSEVSITRYKAMNGGVSPLQVCGQAFFITNGEPVPFWDFMRAIWHRIDQIVPEKRDPNKRLVVGKDIGLVAGSLMEWIGWVTGIEPTLTRYKIAYTCVSRWHNIEKARRVLGYEPEISLEEGIDKLVEWWKTEYEAGKLGTHVH